MGPFPGRSRWRAHIHVTLRLKGPSFKGPGKHPYAATPWTGVGARFSGRRKATRMRRFPNPRIPFARMAGSCISFVRASLVAGFVAKKAQAAFDGGQAVFEAGLHVVDRVLDGFAD